MKKTKIVCTMGPASMEVETIKRMITAGMDLVRLNFSGSHEELRQTIANVRLASKETGNLWEFWRITRDRRFASVLCRNRFC